MIEKLSQNERLYKQNKNELTEEQQRLYDKRAKLKKEAKQIDTIKANVDSYLRPIASQEQKTKRRSELE